MDSNGLNKDTLMGNASLCISATLVVAILTGCASSGSVSLDTPILSKTIYGTNVRIPMPEDSVDACEVDHRVWERAQGLTPSTHHVMTCFANTFDTEKLALGDIVYVVSTYKGMVANTYTDDTFSQISSDIEKQIAIEKASPTGANNVRVVSKGSDYISWIRQQATENSDGASTTVGIYTATMNVKQKLLEVSVSADMQKVGGQNEVVEMGEQWRKMIDAANNAAEKK